MVWIPGFDLVLNSLKVLHFLMLFVEQVPIFVELGVLLIRDHNKYNEYIFLNFLKFEF